jgi:serine/threonine protein kinase
MMDHPNIAKVLDAGTTEVGRPFFVMELVRGIKITNYCDQANLTTKERLDLFIKVCQAIRHAHQKGIVHRDIKPSNILVTLHDGVPVPKVIDFGIAKATEGRLTDATVYTQLHQFIGTPAYMSPEQAEMSGLDIDTRSDIYSLGVLLYELLAGSTPFDAKDLLASGIDAMRKTIREKEPPRPSTRLCFIWRRASPLRNARRGSASNAKATRPCGSASMRSIGFSRTSSLEVVGGSVSFPGSGELLTRQRRAIRFCGSRRRWRSLPCSRCHRPAARFGLIRVPAEFPSPPGMAVCCSAEKGIRTRSGCLQPLRRVSRPF